MKDKADGRPGEQQEIKLELQGVEAPVPWQAVLLPVEQFPMTPPQYGIVRKFLGLLTDVLTDDYGLQQEVLLQMWKLSPATGSSLVSENGASWKPQIGLGVWPDREPPKSWSKAIMMDAVAASFRGDEPAKPYYKLFRLTGDEGKRIEAARTMRGLGVEIQTFSKLDSEALLKRSKELFLPTIEDDRFKKERFYLPLVDRNTISSAGFAERLDLCLCGVDVYIRESAEDRGILILSRLPLESLVEQVRQKSQRKA
ncbi:hypothetical protein [Granulicella mallensis]|uniref:Uncharacterized protein n=1 Tax=Granulicella mallensis (strain ATCC BAA-1857 / DSM 23137 / MP5ACTX8) TaxID=682795 RepID=G8NWN1_GRAMM|nr:hypothetical protein [Granulicella mallensis]AEU38918.1 hypothetical protein AciX8_4648 [Granulicella mallensis MP5ACTX8]